jgi:hypothetical protein
MLTGVGPSKPYDPVFRNEIRPMLNTTPKYQPTATGVDRDKPPCSKLQGIKNQKKR